MHQARLWETGPVQVLVSDMSGDAVPERERTRRDWETLVSPCACYREKYAAHRGV